RPQVQERVSTHNVALDMRDIKGQETAKRALEIAATGGHSLLMTGPPGAGKSMLAARLPGLLPPLSSAEVLETSMIHSIAGQLPNGTLSRQRAFRAPHHSASLPALVGGGAKARPGEITLAHLGVLFLDELPEFSRNTLEALRQPIETGSTLIARANAHITYPARFQLIAAMNPCRCGYLDDATRACARVPKCASEYQSKISGPLFDRIDLHIEVPAVPASDLSLPPPAEGTKEVAARVLTARKRQNMRFSAIFGESKGPGSDPATPRCNAEADGKLLEKIAKPDAEGVGLLTQAVDKMQLSARGYHRVLRVARTLADLEGEDGVRRPHIAESLSYRRLFPGQYGGL
ncbi:MAG: YifB family Mg chelatase-like AAA ATPase, partial [Rhodospirillaceae bacterium]|nr:YifB family Mg chelatase-like AAA ATPase [Rhodospirillaceae bacterium]